MFLNTIGFICVSLCSLCFNNNRLNNTLESINPVTKSAFNYQYNYVVSSTEFCDSLEEWLTFSERRFGDTDNYFYTGIDYFSSGSQVSYSYTDTDFCQDLKWCDIDALIRGSSVSRYPYKNITSIRLTIKRNANNIYCEREIKFSIENFNDRTITFYCFDNEYENSGLAPFDGYFYNANYYYSTNSFIYDEGFMYFNPSVFYEIWFNPNSHNYDVGYYDGHLVGFREGRNEGLSVGYQNGYTDGLNNADYDSTASTIFTGITSIALVPIDMFLRIFNFEILGINVAGLVTGILTMAVIIIVIRMITGNKND